jgi:hypothetical protein
MRPSRSARKNGDKDRANRLSANSGSLPEEIRGIGRFGTRKKV